jgi:hypothetical protein
MNEQTTLLIPEDSKRVADSIIYLLRNTDIDAAIKRGIHNALGVDTYSGYAPLKDKIPVSIREGIEKAFKPKE